MSLRLLAFIFSWFFITSCSTADAPPVQETAEGGTYFSIKGFIKDQWDTYSGQPFTFVKTVSLNGETMLLLGVGFLTSFATAYVVVKWFIKFMQHNSLMGFGWYRIVVGILLLVFNIK